MNAQQALSELIDAASVAYQAHVTDPAGRNSVARIFADLVPPPVVVPREPARLEACRYLPDVLNETNFEAPDMLRLVRAFARVDPYLKWIERTGERTNANAAFANGHANAMIVGPGGLVRHDRVMLGVSLLGPGVRYPDHTHPPEETYLVLSDGEFSQDGITWFTPGIGGTFHNPPGILHAMRTQDAPLLAMWALWVKR